MQGLRGVGRVGHTCLLFWAFKTWQPGTLRVARVMSVDFDILWCLTDDPTAFPYADCGLLTGNFSDGNRNVAFDRCFARERMPRNYGNAFGFGNQRTPLFLTIRVVPWVHGQYVMKSFPIMC